MKLKDYLKEGYLVMGGPSESEDQKFQHRVPIRHPETDKMLMYHFYEGEELQLASDEWAKNKIPIGFRPSAILHVKGFRSIEFEQFNIKEALNILTKLNYKVDINNAGYIAIHLGEFTTKNEAEKNIASLDERLLELSVSYKLSFEIFVLSLGEIYNFQSTYFGPWQDVETKLKGSDYKQIRFSELNEDQIDFLQRLKSFYGQTNIRSKIIVGWTILEDYFYKGKKQIGDKGKEWMTIQHYTELAGIVGYDFKMLYSFRCAKAHEFADKPQAINAVIQLEIFFEEMKSKVFGL